MMGAILPDVRPQHKQFGKPVEIASFKGRINPRYDLADFMGKLANFEHILNRASHEILSDGRNRISVVPFPFSEAKNIEIVVKEFFTRGLQRIKTVFLPSKAQKAWWGGVALMELNIPTPEPVAYLESTRSPFIKGSCYLTLMEKGVDEIRHLFRQKSSDELIAIIQALAQQLRLCHQKGILHRDLSDGNILVRKGLQQEYTFFLIDTNRIRIKKRLGHLQKVKNLTRLGVPHEYQHQFLEAYTETGGLKKWTWFWYRFSKNAYTWRINLKKRLRISGEIKTRNSA
jgi:serine/threonine protein kinase